MALIINNLRKVHEVVLSIAAKRATKPKPNLKITGELKEGDALSKIIETAADVQFDLIVVGHKGDRKIKEIFLGAQAKKLPIKQDAPC